MFAGLDYTYFSNLVIHRKGNYFTCYENKDTNRPKYKSFDTIEECFEYIDSKTKYIEG